MNATFAFVPLFPLNVELASITHVSNFCSLDLHKESGWLADFGDKSLADAAKELIKMLPWQPHVEVSHQYFASNVSYNHDQLA